MKKNVRINMTVTEEVESYLKDLADIGIHGSKPTEVASNLVCREIERLIKDGFLHVKRQKAAG